MLSLPLLSHHTNWLAYTQDVFHPDGSALGDVLEEWCVFRLPFLVRHGYVYSRHDGDTHYISAHRARECYGLPRGLTNIRLADRMDPLRRLPGSICLGPRSEGDYRKHLRVSIREWLEPRAEWVHARTRAEVLESIHALGDMRSVPQWLSYLLLASIGESDPLWHRMLQRISFVAVAREEESPSEVCSAWRERLPSSVSLFVSVDGSYPEGSCPLYSCRPAERGTHLHRAVLAWCLLSSDRFHDVLHSCLMEQERNPTTSALQAEDVLFHGEDD